MKFSLILLFFVLFAIDSTSQTWQRYFSGHKVYEVDVRDSLVIAGLDFRVAVYNMNTGQSTYYMPTTSPAGEPVPIRTVGIDDDNSFWMGISAYGNGLYEYDGNWNNYLPSNSTLPNNNPSNIYVNHSSNRIWLDILNQKATFDGTSYSPIGPYTGDCEEHNDTLWIANSPNGLVEYANGTATLYDTTVTNLSSNDISHVAVDENNKVWFTMRHLDSTTWDYWYTLGSYDGYIWNEYDTTNSSLPFLWQPKKLQVDTNNMLVIATSKGYIEFDGVNSVEYSSNLGNLPDIWVNSLHIDDSGNRWFSTNSSGLLRISNSSIDTIPTSEYMLNSNRSTSVLVASDGKRWFAVNDDSSPELNNGVFMLDNNNVWTSFEEELSEIMGSPYAIEEDGSGNIYVVGRYKTMKFNGSSWVETSCGQGGGVNRSDIAFDNFGNYWKIYYHPLVVKCDDINYEVIYYGGNAPRCVEVDFADNIWIGTQYNIVKMDQNENITTFTSNDVGTSLFSVSDIEFDSQHRLWAVTNSDLVTFDGTNWNSYPFPWDGISTDIEIDDYNNIWVSFLGGIGRFDGADWVVFDNDNTLFIDDYVFEISLDIPNNTLWGSTFSGGVFSYTDSTLLSVDEFQDFDLMMNVYPNPSTDLVNIDIDAKYSKGATISLLDVNGNLIMKQVVSNPNNVLDVSSVDSGFYIIKVTANGTETSRKLVVR